jgi:uroporphyrinogen-III synthase
MSSRILVVRPQPGADRTVARLRARGLNAVAIPLFEVEPRSWSIESPKCYDALMLTSANALRYGGQTLGQLLDLPTYAVAAATADAAQAAGFPLAWVGNDDAQSLIGKLEADGHQRVLHLCGEDVRAFDPGSLKVERCVTYAARQAAPSAEFQKILADAAIVMLHSPRAAARFAELCTARSTVTLVTISTNAANAAGAGWQKVAVAANKSDEAMIDLVAQLDGLENG